MTPTFAIMITTHNRLTDLQRTVAALKELQPQPDELLITADGCIDGTVTFVREALPEAQLFINPKGKGSVASRDIMLRKATADIVLSLDDDSYPEQTDCLATLGQLFTQYPNVAVAHFPQRTDEYIDSMTQANWGAARNTGSFANSGAAFRRSVYLHLPGFPTFFFHAYEEPDYALQCVAAGYDVLLSPIITIRHHYSGVSRNEQRVHHHHARNELWSTWLRCPFPQVVPMTIWRIGSQLNYARKRGLKWVMREPRWWYDCLRGISKCIKQRNPVSWENYRKWLILSQ